MEDDHHQKREEKVTVNPKSACLSHVLCLAMDGNKKKNNHVRLIKDDQ